MSVQRSPSASDPLRGSPSLMHDSTLTNASHKGERTARVTVLSYCSATWLKVNLVFNVHRNHKAYLGRGYEGGGRGRLYIPIATDIHYHHQNDFRIKMSSDESHFNVSVGSDGQSHRTVSTNHTTFLKRKESRSGIEPRSFRLPA